MKPIGPLPPEFADQRDTLIIGGKSADQWIENAGDTPVFIYDLAIAEARIQRLRAALPQRVGIHYAVKANPLPALVAALAPLVDGLDVASGGELAMVSAAAPGTRVSFAGPGKRGDEIAAAIRAGTTINVESEGEARRALAIGDTLGIVPSLAIRVNPAFDLRGSGMKMGGRASPFGVDAERVPELARTIQSAGADWRGFHIFAGSQALDTNAIIESQAATLALADTMAEAIGAVPPLVNIGGGFGVPYFPGDQSVNVEAVGEALAGAMTSGSGALDGAGFAIELGRWLVAECGVYLMRVVDRKESRGETFLVTDGGLHHQLAATGNFGTVVRRNYPIALANQMGGAAAETVTVVGCLCTPLDRFADQAGLPRGDVGDVIAVFMAGAYGYSASPTGFLGHPLPREILVDPKKQS